MESLGSISGKIKLEGILLLKTKEERKGVEERRGEGVGRERKGGKEKATVDTIGLLAPTSLTSACLFTFSIIQLKTK